MADRVCIGQFLGGHGVHGRVKLKSFTEVPDSLFTYGPLSDESGSRIFVVRPTGMGKDHFLAEVDGIRDRTQADALKGVRLYVDRSRLPDPADEDEFYHADLIGLATETSDGQPFGVIKAIYDFGAGDMLEIRHVSDKTVFLPFTKACVPVLDVKAGRIVVEPPDGFFASAGPRPPDDIDESLAGEPAGTDVDAGLDASSADPAPEAR